MIPLCTTRNSFVLSEVCGWLFRGAGGPCVAQRVCPIPQWFSKYNSGWRFSFAT